MKARNITTTKTLTSVVAILILAAGVLTSVAMSQDKGGVGFAPAGYYTGVESSAGTLEPISGVTFGNTVVLNSFGEWETYCLSVSLDYSTTQFVPNSFIATGGTWSLVVFREGVYFGTIYGTISSGNILVAENVNGDPIQLTQLQLRGTGGLGSFERNSVRDISGYLNTITDLRSKSVAGSVELNF